MEHSCLVNTSIDIFVKIVLGVKQITLHNVGGSYVIISKNFKQKPKVAGEGWASVVHSQRVLEFQAIPLALLCVSNLGLTCRFQSCQNSGNFLFSTTNSEASGSS